MHIIWLTTRDMILTFANFCSFYLFFSYTQSVGRQLLQPERRCLLLFESNAACTTWPTRKTCSPTISLLSFPQFSTARWTPQKYRTILTQCISPCCYFTVLHLSWWLKYTEHVTVYCLVCPVLSWHLNTHSELHCFCAWSPCSISVHFTSLDTFTDAQHITSITQHLRAAEYRQNL